MEGQAVNGSENSIQKASQLYCKDSVHVCYRLEREESGLCLSTLTQPCPSLSAHRSCFQLSAVPPPKVKFCPKVRLAGVCKHPPGPTELAAQHMATLLIGLHFNSTCSSFLPAIPCVGSHLPNPGGFFSPLCSALQGFRLLWLV